MADPLGNYCPFCDYAGPSVIIAGDADTFIIEPMNPVVDGHVLVIPREHVEHFAESSRVTMSVMAAAAMYVWSHGIGDANLITSKGEAATQTVRHFHVHIVPRAHGDGLRLPWA